jgi:hypothetical protein
VQHGGARAARHAGHDAGGQSPHHEGTGGRYGQEVGGEGGHGQPVGGADEQWCHEQLGADRDGDDFGHRAGPGQQVPQAAGQHDDPQRRGHGQPESQGTHEQRIDEQEGGHGQPQNPQRRQGPPGAGCGHGQDGHGGGAQHRRLEAGHEGEEQQARDGRHDAGPEAEAAQQRPQQDQHKNDVLPGNGQEMREAGGPEIGDGGIVLPPVIAEHEPVEQGALARGQRFGTAVQQAAQTVGRAGQRAAGVDPPDLGRGEAADQMAGQCPIVAGRPGLDRTDDRHHLAGEGGAESPGGRSPGRKLVPVTAGPHVGPHRPEGVVGVGDQFGRTPEGRRFGRTGAVDGPVGQRGRQQGRSEDEQHRPPDAPRHDGQDEREGG